MIRRSAPISVLIPFLAACNADSEVLQVNTASMTEIELPEVLRTVSGIDPTELQLQVSVNDVATDLARGDDDIWRGSVNVPVNQSSRVAVEWGTDHGTSGYLKLAEQQKSVFVRTDAASVAFDNDYVIAFDLDRDSRFNLTELEQNRSPVNLLDVTINVDGTFPTGGVMYPPSGICGQRIPIGVLTNGTESDHQAWWCATLEDELIDADGNVQEIDNLRVVVSVRDEQIITDSDTNSENVSHQDDSVEIFIDGDGNRGASYDGSNDFQFRFAPLGEGVFSRERGPFLPANLNGSFEFTNEGYILTATIPLRETGIENGFPFGITIEVNDDDDGGLRDAKYAWIGTEGEDISWFNPTGFGVSQVP